MRVLLLLLLIGTPTAADEAVRFLDQVCIQGFTKTTMPKGEATRFCACVRDDVVSRLSNEQRRTLSAAQEDLARGRTPSAERLVSTGVRDLVVAGQARCEAAFYPPSAPINIVSGPLQLTLRCEEESRQPQAFVYRSGMALLSKAEQRNLDQRMLKGNFDPEYAKVTTVIDGRAPKTENWEIDLTGEIVSPQNSAQFIDQLRAAATMSLSIERGVKREAGTFQVRGKIPSRWAPCGGVSH